MINLLRGHALHSLSALAVTASLGLGLTGAAQAEKSHHKPHSAKKADANHNGIADKWEHRYGLKGSQAKKDNDHDGLTNLTEFQASTNPTRKDSDRDGQRDGVEDGDHDGLSNRTEQNQGTNPGKADSDNDECRDGGEDSDSNGTSNLDQQNHVDISDDAEAKDASDDDCDNADAEVGQDKPSNNAGDAAATENDDDWYQTKIAVKGPAIMQALFV